jgi:hypothetical protein
MFSLIERELKVSPLRHFPVLISNPNTSLLSLWIVVMQSLLYEHSYPIVLVLNTFHCEIYHPPPHCCTHYR